MTDDQKPTLAEHVRAGTIIDATRPSGETQRGTPVPFEYEPLHDAVADLIAQGRVSNELLQERVAALRSALLACAPGGPEVGALDRWQTWWRESGAPVIANTAAVSPQDKLALLATLCECEVSVTINGHRNLYQTAERALADMEALVPGDLDAETRAAIIAANRIVEVQCYPSTSIGFYRIVHHDLNVALDEALQAVRAERGSPKREAGT